MIKEIQGNKTTKEVYALDTDGRVVFICEMGTDHVEGSNEYGQEFSNADDGLYEEGNNGDTEIMYPDDLTSDNVPYGWAYINIDERGRAFHGGGTGLDDPFAPYQDELLPTLGCFRLNNNDVFWLANAKKRSEAAGIDVLITIVE